MSKAVAIELWSRHSVYPAITLWACWEGEGSPNSENLLTEALRRHPVFPADLIEHLPLQKIVDRVFSVEVDRREEPARIRVQGSVMRAIRGGHHAAMAV